MIRYPSSKVPILCFLQAPHSSQNECFTKSSTLKVFFAHLYDKEETNRSNYPYPKKNTKTLYCNLNKLSRIKFLPVGLGLYLSTIPTYNSRFNSHLNSHFLLSRSGNSFLKNSHFSK